MDYSISVIVPIYNVEKYLDQCIQSLFSQTLENIEIILVDDQSPDHCPELCDRYAEDHPNIKVIHKKNAGLGMACNSGLELASGKYVAFLDSDDWVDPEMYFTMFEAVEKNHCDMVFTGLKRVDNDGRLLGYLDHRDTFQLFEREEIQELAKDMIASSPEIAVERTIQMSAKVVLYRRDVLQKNNLRFVSEREVLSEDLHFNLSVLRHSSRVCILPQSFYNYRITPLSITANVKLTLFERYKNLYYYVIRECDELLIKNAEQRVQRMFIGFCRTYIRQIFQSSYDSKSKKDTIRAICKDPVWTSIFDNYPVSKMPLGHRLFFCAMRYNQFFILKALSAIKK